VRYGTRGAGARARVVAALVVAILGFAVFVVFVGAWVIVGLVPELAAVEPWSRFARADDLHVTAFLVAAAAAAVGLTLAVVRPVRWILVGVFGAAALLLGFVAYYPCTPSANPFWTAVLWTIETFFVSVEEPFGQTGGACPADYPQSLLASRLMGLLTVALVAGGIVAEVFRDRLDQWRARRAPRLVLFAGLDESTVSAARAVARELVPGQTLVYLVDGGEQAFAVGIARETGGLVVPLVVDDTKPTRQFLATRIERVEGIHLMSGDIARTLRTMNLVGELLSRLPENAERTGRLIVRMDNPWQAEPWRRQHMVSYPGWLTDAISALELAARHLVVRLRDEGVATIVMDGGSRFELAVLAETVLQHRVHALLPDSAFAGRVRRTPPIVRLVGAGAEGFAEIARAQFARFGIDADDTFRVEPATTWTVDAGSVVVVGERDPGHSDRLTATHPEWRILQWDPSVVGLAPGGAIEGLTLVGPTFEPVPGQGIDIWELVGRIQHLWYLENHWNGEPQAGDPARGAWDLDLSPFYRASNVRTFATAVRTARTLGLSIATRLGPRPDDEHRHAFDERELEALTVAEHESWRRLYEADGWRLGHERGAPSRPDRARRLHPDLVDWDDLPAPRRDIDRTAVLAAFRTLDALGFVVADDA